MTNPSPLRDRPLAAIVEDIKNETSHFFGTRLHLFLEEMQLKWPQLRMTLPLLGLALLLLVSGWFLLNAAAVFYVALIFAPSPHAWIYSCLIFGIAWMAVGIFCGMRVMQIAKPKNLIPRKTVEVFKKDKVWLQKGLSA